MLSLFKQNRKTAWRNRDRGFTLIEILVVLAMVGILTAIAAPSWTSFVNNQRLTAVQSRAFSTLRLAQSYAKRDQTMWQASFRNTANFAQYAIHKAPPVTPVNPAQTYWDSLPWENFEQGVRIVENETTETPPRTNFTKKNAVPNVYRVQFQDQGVPNGLGEIGRIVFINKNGGDRRKCVIISTILGSMRTASDSECN